MPDRLIANRYQVLRELGSGGRGTVYLARDAHTGATVSLKVLHPHLTKALNFPGRFEREARAAMGLESPHVVRILDHGQDGDQHFLVTEYVEGKTLAQLLQERGRLSADEALSITTQVAEALQAAHRAGVTHGDIKPGNVIIAEDGTAKVSDFGIAKALWDLARSQRSLFRATPEYAAPELLQGRADIRSDIYSLGVVLYEMLSGRVPFEADNPMAVMRLHVVAQPPPLRLADPAGVEAILERCLAKNPIARFQEPGELLQALPAQAPAGATPHEEGPPRHVAPARPSAGHGRRKWLYGGLALAGGTLAVVVAVLAFLISANSSGSTSMPGPAWWDTDFRFRQPITVTAGAAAVPSGYSVSVTLGHAGLVSSGESQDDGDDVRVLYWTGTGWLELDRVLEPGSSWNSDSTKIWFKLQAGIDTSSSDGDYYLYYGNPTASDPPADESGVFQFADFFDRADSDVVGRGWAVYESTGDVDIGSDALVFNLTSDLDNRPVADHTFTPISDGLVWRIGFNWVRSPVEQTYRVQMQLGNSSNMANPPPETDTFANAGVGPSLLWAGPDQGMRDQDGLGYEIGQAVTEAEVVSGAADVEVVANVSAGSYDLYVDDVLRASGVSFSSAQTAVDEVRFLTWKVNQVNFGSRQFDYTYVRRYVDPEPATSLASKETRP
jgi:serine/threonine protein kinase